MVIPNTYLNLSNIVLNDFELGRVMSAVAAADLAITEKVKNNAYRSAIEGFVESVGAPLPLAPRIERENSCISVQV